MFEVSEQALPPGEVTRLLQAWSQGDQSALDRLTPIVYAELHRQARLNLNQERVGHLLQPSALVNEAFLRLIGGAPVEWESRTHFFAIFARLMRRILIDFARAQETGKRGSHSPHVDLSEAADQPSVAATPVRFLDLDAALDDLSRVDERQARVVELRYFGGLENNEIANVLGVSLGTVSRDWRLARAFLYSRLQPLKQPLA
jgi:RNA polymerase sigma factor (TIGR02999 family)